MNDTDLEAEAFGPDLNRLNDEPQPDSSTIQDAVDSLSDEDDEIFRIQELVPPVKPDFEIEELKERYPIQDHMRQPGVDDNDCENG